MTLTGKLDFEGDTARIEGDSQASRKMLPAAAKWCAERLKKGMIVDAELVPDGDKHGWISKIYEHKNEAKQPANTGTCTSPGSPVVPPKEPAKPASDGLPKSVEGKLQALSFDTRLLVLWREDFKMKISWMPAQDAVLEKFKQWDPVKVTFEPSGSNEPNRLIDIVSTMKKSGGWGGGKPRNERLILFQNMHTAALNGAMHATTPDSQDYDEFMDMVYVRAKKDTDQAMKDFSGGV